MKLQIIWDLDKSEVNVFFREKDVWSFLKKAKKTFNMKILLLYSRITINRMHGTASLYTLHELKAPAKKQINTHTNLDPS